MPDNKTDVPGGVPDRNRRNVWRSAMAVLGLASGSAMAQVAKTTETPRRKLWVQANQLFILHGDKAEQAMIDGQCIQISGRSYTQARLQCGLPLSFSMMPDHMKITAVLLRIRCGSGAQIQTLRLFDGERELACLDQLGIHAGNWQDIRMPLDQPLSVARGIGLGIDVAFDATGRHIDFSALGCEIIS